jgi:hypothetical protein
LDQRNSGNLWYTLDSQMASLFDSVTDWSKVQWPSEVFSVFFEGWLGNAH